MKSEESKLMKKINDTGDYSDEIKKGIQSAIEKFIKTSSW
jgi:F-type H+-transporting ATPase subunit alpha